MPRTLPLRLVAGFAIAIILDTVTQLLWKSAVTGITDSPDLWQMAASALHQPLFLLVVALMLGQFLNWMLVLHQADLSFAHAVSSLSYATVALASVLVLGEQVDLVQGTGIALILGGVWLVSRTGHRTEPAQATPAGDNRS